MESGIRCICFARSRSLIEWIYASTLSGLEEDLRCKVSSYRGGYSRELRRDIEVSLFNKSTLVVVATNALELGIDISEIDLTLHVGYPGSKSSLLQQAGRAGRGAEGASAAVMVCFNGAVEQRMYLQPKSLLSGFGSSGGGEIDEAVLASHLLCASNEAGLEKDCWKEFGVSEDVWRRVVGVLVSRGKLLKQKLDGSYAGAGSTKYAWKTVSLRNIEPVQYDIVLGVSGARNGEGEVLDKVPYSRVFYHCFPGAIILHRGQQYMVVELDPPPKVLDSSQGGVTKKAKVMKSKALYKTMAIQRVRVTVTRVLEIEGMGGVCTGVVNVKRTVWAYAKISKETRAVISTHELTIPSIEMDTRGLWLPCDGFGDLRKELGEGFGEGVHALGHAIIVAAGVELGCGAGDLDCVHAWEGVGRVMLFDGKAGGTGVCDMIWENIVQGLRCDGSGGGRGQGGVGGAGSVLKTAIDILRGCENCGICPSKEAEKGGNEEKGGKEDKGDGDGNDCEEKNIFDCGCPSCIQNKHCIRWNEGLSRRAGVRVGERIVEELVKGSARMNLERSVGSGRGGEEGNLNELTPRKRRRQHKLIEARKLESARARQIVVGRPSWPTDDMGADSGGIGMGMVNDNYSSTYILGEELVKNAGWIANEDDFQWNIDQIRSKEF